MSDRRVEYRTDGSIVDDTSFFQGVMYAAFGLFFLLPATVAVTLLAIWVFHQIFG